MKLISIVRLKYVHNGLPDLRVPEDYKAPLKALPVLLASAPTP